MAEYKIQSETLTAIADAIRAKKATTAIFSPAQMAVEIEGIVIDCDDLQNAEDVSFGTVNGDYEYGISVAKSDTTWLLYGTIYHGYQFTANQSFGVYGFRFCPNANKVPATHTFYLYDVTSGEMLATLSNNVSTAGSWLEFLLTSPVNLKAGNSYMVYAHNNNSGTTLIKSKHTYNTKITYTRTMNSEANPPVDEDTTYYSAIDIIIGPLLTESVTAEYIIQTDTITSIADEVKRITGASGTLSLEQIITALEGVAVQSTE